MASKSEPFPRGADRARRDPLFPLLLGAFPFFLFVALPLAALFLFVDPREALNHLGSETAGRALLLTLRTTLVATLLCAVLGIPVALLLARRRFPGHAVVDTLVDVPIAVPPVVVGVALLLAFGRFGILGRHLHALGISVGFTTTAVVLAQAFIAMPFLIRSARAGFEAVDPALERAARVLGASPWRVFRTVTFPLAWPAVSAGLVLAWARALSEFGATITFAGNFPGRTQTLSLAVMSALEADLETAVSIAALTLVLAAGALVLARFLGRRALEARG
jgi:molybdate transport system permease protein